MLLLNCRKYKKDNREKMNEYRREWAALNKDKVSQMNRRYREKIKSKNISSD